MAERFLSQLEFRLEVVPTSQALLSRFLLCDVPPRIRGEGGCCFFELHRGLGNWRLAGRSLLSRQSSYSEGDRYTAMHGESMNANSNSGCCKTNETCLADYPPGRKTTERTQSFRGTRACVPQARSCGLRCIALPEALGTGPGGAKPVWQRTNRATGYRASDGP